MTPSFRKVPEISVEALKYVGTHQRPLIALITAATS